jgi:hypothetical protein
MLLESSSTEADEYHEPPSIAVTRLVCQTLVVMTVLFSSLALLTFRPEYGSAAIALMGVVVGACFGLVRLDPMRRRRKEER